MKTLMNALIFGLLLAGTQAHAAEPQAMSLVQGQTGHIYNAEETLVSFLCGKVARIQSPDGSAAASHFELEAGSELVVTLGRTMIGIDDQGSGFMLNVGDKVLLKCNP